MRKIAMLLFGSVLLSSAAVQALEVTVSIAPNPGDSGTQGGSFSSFEHLSAASVLDAGGTAPDIGGNTVTARTRYAQMAWADSSFFATDETFSADYRVTVDIVSAGGYDLTIDTSRLGAMTLVDDTFGGSTVGSFVTLGAVTGQVDTSGNAGLSLPELSYNEALALATLGYGTAQGLEIDQSNTVTLSGLSGNLQILLDFSWTVRVYSNNDESALRLGMTSSVSGVSADDYPGVQSRVAADDGHFVDITATVSGGGGAPIPEPESALLLIVGLVVAGAALRRSRVDSSA